MRITHQLLQSMGSLAAMKIAVQEALVAKCRALDEEGITAHHWAGSYRIPPATLLGSIQQDMCFIESCVGVGEIAISDHRSSAPTPHELARVARCAPASLTRLSTATMRSN
jgi:hypothetical protein